MKNISDVQNTLKKQYRRGQIELCFGQTLMKDTCDIRK